MEASGSNQLLQNAWLLCCDAVLAVRWCSGQQRAVLVNKGGIMYHRLSEQEQVLAQRRAAQMEHDIFSFLKLAYSVKDISIGQDEHIHTIFVSANATINSPQRYFLSHGFGGSSLMHFTALPALLEKGDVILWEVRGMGVGPKLKEYVIQEVQQIEAFFLKGIEAMLLHYNFKDCTFVCHSFSAYLLLRFSIRHPQFAQDRIKKLVLLSPIGITTKEEDYKNYINGCSDLLHTLLNKFGWAFNLTYKSPLRTICSCCKTSLIMGGLKKVGSSEREKELMCKLIETLVLLPDGSDPLFFRYFQPRPLMTSEPAVETVLIYGGEEDWVDKSGGKKISARFPGKIKMASYQCGHNIPFHTEVMTGIAKDLL